MAQFLHNKNIILGVTGGIAAYKSADLTRRLHDAGAQIRVVMTENAKQFITPLTMQAVSGNPVHDDLFDLKAEAAMGHIELARWADLVLIAPATADCMARLAHGNADDLLTTLCLATKAPIAIAPAMNQGMWVDPFTQENYQALMRKKIHILEPAVGLQACGDIGPGRMMEPLDIVARVDQLFATGALAGVRIVITAGPTHEHLDPVRYITNGSSGKMGYALAAAAREAGAAVTLISGPVQLPVPTGIECEQVISAQEMHDSVMKKVPECDIFLAVAAVSDYRPYTRSGQKIHKQNSVFNLQLEPTIDIAASVGALTVRPFIVGFAAETDNVIAKARAKRERKNMNMIIANDVSGGQGMNAEGNAVTIITAFHETSLPLMPKTKLARELIQSIATEFKNLGLEPDTNPANLIKEVV